MSEAKNLETIFAEVLDLSPEEITDDLSPDTCTLWDSLNHLRLVTEIEGSFGIQFTMAEVQAAVSVQKFRDLLELYLS